MCGLCFYLSALLQLVWPALHLLGGEKDIAPFMLPLLSSPTTYGI